MAKPSPLLKTRIEEKVDLKGLKLLASEFARQRSARELILLDGELGAGKTQFVTFFVEAMGGRQASSPTFAIHQSYETPPGTIDHVDLYRLKDDRDLESTGFWDLFREPQGMILVEWASRLGEHWMPDGWRWTRLELRRDRDYADLRTIIISERA